MRKPGYFYLKDFEALLWDIIENENQVSGFPTGGNRYPWVHRELGDVGVELRWRVDNTVNGREIESYYAQVSYSARIKGVNGAFGGDLGAKKETYFD
jgi:hypothetical protein